VSKRDYDEEYRNYQGNPEQKKNRAKRNAARRELAREGLVRKGDNMDVDHKRPLAKGGGTSRSNLRVLPESANRSFQRTKNAGMK
jgi:5-methylcytosine-specific restriction endonuclease McrA